MKNHVPTTSGLPRDAGVYVGDFPPGPMYEPFDPWLPNLVPNPIVPQKLYPVGPAFVPNVGLPSTWPTAGIVTITSSDPQWNLVTSHDRITASVDMPGVRAQDLTVEIENGVIKASAQRFDTKLHVSRQQVIGTDYDPKTAEATIEAGVLTVTVMRFKDRVTHRVPVTGK